MNKVIVLIDFDNHFDIEQSKYSSELFEYSFTQLVNICQEEFNNFEFIEFRLYGGWYRKDILTKQASSIQQLLRNVNVFPKVLKEKVIKGTIAIASTLFEIPDMIWNHSYKDTDGVNRIRINHESVDEICNENRNLCPKFILHKFTRKKDQLCNVENCDKLQKNVFKGSIQKMVDTMIACDIISISESDSTVGMLIISEDQDHLPSLAIASLRKKDKVQSIILGINNTHLMDLYSSMLLNFKIKIKLL